MVGAQQTGESNIKGVSVVTGLDCGTQVIKASPKDRRLEFYVKDDNPGILTVKKAIRKIAKNLK